MMVCVHFFYNRSADAIFNIVVKADESIESPVESGAPTTEYMINLWSYQNHQKLLLCKRFAVLVQVKQ